MFNAITQGLIKAMRYIVEGSQRRKHQKMQPRYRFEQIGHHITLKVARHTLSEEQLAMPLHKLDYRMAQAIPLRIAILNDNSRYTGEKLRAIRAKGGKRETARRFARMNANAPLALAAE